jgi:hypothetical protein
MRVGIVEALREFARDEGTVSALVKAEKWRDTLEEMLEVANEQEFQFINQVLSPVREAFTHLT